MSRLQVRGRRWEVDQLIQELVVCQKPGQDGLRRKGRGEEVEAVNTDNPVVKFGCEEKEGNEIVSRGKMYVHRGVLFSRFSFFFSFFLAFFFFFWLPCTACGILTSLTRNQITAPCSGSTDSQPLDHQGRPLFSQF